MFVPINMAERHHFGIAGGGQSPTLPLRSRMGHPHPVLRGVDRSSAREKKKVRPGRTLRSAHGLGTRSWDVDMVCGWVCGSADGDG